MSRVVALLTALVVLLFAHAASAAVELYTFGPGSYLFARYGHSLLCVEERCYDYGVPDREDPTHMTCSWSRCQAILRALGIQKEVRVRAVRDQGRSVGRQVLPLSYV